MKLRNKLSIITATSMLAFAGVAFAAWTFNNSVAQEAQESAYVTSAINAKNVQLSGNTTVYLVLDQAKPYWSTAVNNGSKPVELANGKITVTPDYDLQNQMVKNSRSKIQKRELKKHNDSELLKHYMTCITEL